MMTRLLIAALALSLAACSARPERFDKKDETEVETTEPKEDPITPLTLRDGEVPVQMLESSGTTQEMMIGDLRVIHKSTPNNPVVAARLYQIGGSAGLTEENAGIEKLALTVAASGGSESTPKDEFNAALDSTGSSVYSFAEREWSGYGMKSLVDHFDSTWGLFTEIVMEPAMPKEEVELARTRQLAQIKSLLEDPDTHVAYVAGQNMFDEHPYATMQIGTEENVAKFEHRQLREYQRAQLDTSKMLLVVVGNVPSQKLIDSVKSSLGKIVGSGSEPATVPDFTSTPNTVFVDRELPTNYVLGYFDAPAPGDPDYPAMLVAIEFIRDKLFEEVRTKRNLTYAVSAGLGERRANYVYVYVTAVDPETTMRVIFDVLEEMTVIKLSKADLEQTINVFITDHYMGLETNGAQAGMLAQSQIIEGSWKRSDAFLDRINAVTPEQVLEVSKKYLKDYRFGVVGKAEGLDKAYFTP